MKIESDEKILLPLNDKLRTHGIHLVILFGSQADGVPGTHSDVDIAIVGEEQLTLNEVSQVKTILADTYHYHEDAIDLIETRHASPLLQFEIGEKGKLLWGSEAAFIHFRVLAWRRYLDTAKLRRVREEYLKKVYAK